jgi:CRISPR-associated protein Csb1
MATKFTSWHKYPRLLLEAPLTPLQGNRFQTTGFADLGPARYQLPDGTEMLLVESAQSVANRLESVCWDDANSKVIPALEGISYIVVNRSDGSLLTSSIQEAHRINSPYILEGADDSVLKMLKEDVKRMDKGPVDLRLLSRIVLKYDANAVLHGVFLAKSELAGGRLRMPRLLSGFIEARDVRVAESGGVKNDRVDPTGNAKQGFGHVPFHRTEFTAQSITAYFNLDLAQLFGYGLEDEASDLLIALAMFKIRRFLDTGLRLRSACDLQMTDGLKVTRPTEISIPGEVDLLESLKASIAACRKKKLFTDPPITELRWKERPASGKKSGKPESAEDAEGEE